MTLIAVLLLLALTVGLWLSAHENGYIRFGFTVQYTNYTEDDSYGQGQGIIDNAVQRKRSRRR